MTEIERALTIYDGDGSKPFCDLVWKALYEKRDRDNGCNCSADVKQAIRMQLEGNEVCCPYKFCPLCGRRIKTNDKE